MCTLLESYHHPLQGNGVKLKAGILSTLLSSLWDDERCAGKRPFPSCSFVVTFHTAPSLYQGMSLPKAGISQFGRIHLHAVFSALESVFFLQPQCGGENGRDYSELDTIQVQMEM